MHNFFIDKYNSGLTPIGFFDLAPKRRLLHWHAALSLRFDFGRGSLMQQRRRTSYTIK